MNPFLIDGTCMMRPEIADVLLVLCLLDLFLIIASWMKPPKNGGRS